jgi:uncharacterized YccA/Bax inhibitor family protein
LIVTSSNPAFSRELFAGYQQVYGGSRSTVMTVQGAVGKTALMLAILSATAIWSWSAVADGRLSTGMLGISAIGGLVIALITSFSPRSSPITAPIYAALEGVFLGALSRVVELAPQFPKPLHGIAFQAVILTAGVTFVMLFAYQTRLIRVTEKLRSGIIIATGALCLFYLVTWLMRLFGAPMPSIFGPSPLGIGLSVLVVGLAAFNLLLDFDFIEQCAYSGAPKYMEWYGAFGLMVTLVWLYVEILRLLMLLAASQREE